MFAPQSRLEATDAVQSTTTVRMNTLSARALRAAMSDPPT
jgi:hypothetical protein